jgi:hypothetical protein
MTVEVSPEEIRIEHTVDDQVALTRAFTGCYVVLALVAFVVAAVVRPELLLVVVLFAGMLVLWSWQVRRAQERAEPWVVVLTPDELRHSAVGVDVRIQRSEAAEVHIVERPGPRMRLHVLEVRDADGSDLLTVSLPGRDEATMLGAALEEWGWPTR